MTPQHREQVLEALEESREWIAEVAQWIRELPGLCAPPAGTVQLLSRFDDAIALLRGDGVAPDDQPKTLTLNYEPDNRAFWHTDCANHFGGVVYEIKREKNHSLLECQHCKQRGYYAVGWVGPHTVSVEPAEGVAPAAPTNAEMSASVGIASSPGADAAGMSTNVGIDGVPGTNKEQPK